MTTGLVRTALITGAAQGLGFEIAQTLAHAGHQLVMVDQSPTLGAAVAKLPGATAAQLDVANENAVKALQARLAKRNVAIDILVNCAGITGRQGAGKTLVEDTDLAIWNQVLEVNTTGPFLLCRTFAPAMMDRGWGRIINLSSQAARTRTESANSYYAASKAALIGFSRGLALEIASRGVTVNCIAPGRITTPMTVATGTAGDSAYATRAALGHVGEPQDIAATVAFLCSDDAGYITGATLDVNGGYSMQ
jgi:3-oxoacyl-[acyl-carrier protein] reductase